MKISTGRILKPRRVMLYGIHGCGKSTWASQAPGVFFLDCEDGLNDIDCAKTRCLSYGDVVNAVSWLMTEPHDFKWVAVDTLDWLQALVFEKTYKDAGVQSIEQVGGGYGKGYEAATKQWEFLLKGFDALRERRGMGIVLLAHAKVTKFKSPESDSYDRYEPDLHKTHCNMIQEWCDEVLFASYRVFTRTEELGFSKTRSIAVGGKERFVRTNESAFSLAKNRLRLPDELPMEWPAFAQYLPQANGQAAVVQPLPGNTVAPVGDINGLVANGSSKVEG